MTNRRDNIFALSRRKFTVENYLSTFDLPFEAEHAKITPDAIRFLHGPGIYVAHELVPLFVKRWAR